MFQVTISLLIGLATLLIILSISTSRWHSVRYDGDGYVQSHSGLWHQILSVRTLSDVSDAECAKNSPSTCESIHDPGLKVSPCKVLDGRCGTKQAYCAKQTKCDAPSDAPCKRSPFTGDCVHDYDTEFDISIPYNGYSKADDKRGFVDAARLLGILSASFASAGVVVASVSTPRPMLTAMFAGVATLCAIALLVVYDTKLKDSFLSSGVVKGLKGDDDSASVAETHATHATHIPITPITPGQFPRSPKQILDLLINNYANKDIKERDTGAGFYGVAAGAVLLGLATVLGIVDRSVLLKAEA